MRSVTNRAAGAVLLLALLAGFLVLAALPDQLAEIRVAGLSLLWWYGGLIAPVLSVLVTAAGAPVPPSPAGDGE